MVYGRRRELTASNWPAKFTAVTIGSPGIIQVPSCGMPHDFQSEHSSSNAISETLETTMPAAAKPRIAIIIGSTRATRFADKPAQWMLKQVQARNDMDVELVDLRDYDLPFFNEKASNLWMPSVDPKVVKWQQKLAEFDGYIFVVAEYNRSVTGSLKNAMDQAYKEWNRKPMAAIGYGGLGAARAVEHLRLIAVELQMVPVRNGVHIGGGEFMKIHPMGGNAPIAEIETALLPSAKAMMDDVVWWSKATMAARG
jgi:NAD(P)H-dependent FMN reductase